MSPETLAELDAPQPPEPAATPGPMLVQMTRGYLWVTATASAGGALLLALTTWTLTPGPALVALFSLLAAAAAGAALLPARVLAAGLTTVLAAGTLAIGAAAHALGWGLAAPGLPLTGLMICVLCAAAGWRAGAVLSAVAVATVGTLAAVSGASPEGLPSVAHQLGLIVLSIGSGLACGVLLSRVLARHVRDVQEREDRFRRLLALAADAYWETDQSYRLIAASDRSGGLDPLDTDCALGRVPWEVPYFDCDPETQDQLQADADARLPFRDVPVRWTHADGGTRAYRVSGEPRFNERGVFTGYWGVARDVSAIEAAQEALAATETRYQELFTRIPTPLLLHRGGRIVDANPAGLELLGHDRLETLVGTDLLALYHAGDSRERARRRDEALEESPLGTALPVADFRIDGSDGRVLSVRSTSVRVQSDSGPALLSIYIDDSDRLAVEEAVRRSEALLSHLVTSSPDLITLTETISGRLAMVNASFERTSGWTAAEAVGRTAAELGWWPDAAERERFDALIETRTAVTDVAATFTTRDGQSVSMIVSAARFVMDRREYLVMTGRDVTDKERERLQREAILANASVGIAVTRHGRFELANRHFAQIYGWPDDEIVGQPCDTVWLSDADYRAVAAQTAPALAQGEPFEVERQARRRDGSSFVARIRGRVIDPAHPDDSGTVWIVEDVTERRRFERALATARDDAEAANRAKSAFLANTSHELRTPLNGIIGLARMAREDALPDERRRQYLDQISQSAQSLADIISDILDLSKIEAGKLLLENTAFDLGAELQALHRTYLPLAAARGLELRLDVAPEACGNASGDPLRMRQIASNFLANAVKFTATGWVAFRARRPGGPGSRVLRLEVQDSGPGIDAATRRRLFQPFTQADQSTTRRYGGTGLGLSICHELATLMGGAVGVDSEVGQGSTFWAELPLPPTASAPAAPAAAGAAARGEGGLRGKRVLMVEDNPVNMMIAVAMIERWGVAVTQAQDGREALAAVEAAAATGEPFDAVLMDVQMPVMSGHEATRALRAAGHRMPVVALTAAALVTEREAALEAGMNDFLTKPIDADKLRAALVQWCTAAGATADGLRQ